MLTFSGIGIMNSIIGNTEEQIKQIVKKERFSCGKEIIDTFIPFVKVKGCQEGKEFCTFTHLWLSSLAGIAGYCKNDCIMAVSGVRESKFLLRKMKESITRIWEVKKEKICLQSDPRCLGYVARILSDDFTSDRTIFNVRYLWIVVNGIYGQLDQKYSIAHSHNISDHSE